MDTDISCVSPGSNCDITYTVLSSLAPDLVVVGQSGVKGAELEEAELEEGEQQKKRQRKQVGGQRRPMIGPCCWILGPGQLHLSSPPSGSRASAAPQVLSAGTGHRSGS